MLDQIDSCLVVIFFKDHEIFIIVIDLGPDAGITQTVISLPSEMVFVELIELAVPAQHPDVGVGELVKDVDFRIVFHPFADENDGTGTDEFRSPHTPPEFPDPFLSVVAEETESSIAERLESDGVRMTLVVLEQDFLGPVIGSIHMFLAFRRHGSDVSLKNNWRRICASGAWGRRQ
jgi:hypothetical protein